MAFPQIAPSLMCMDLLKLKEQIEFFNDKIAYFHVDIMDGHFVPNLTLSPFFVEQIAKIATAKIDCHLMVTDPTLYIEMLRQAGSTMISFHAEVANGRGFRLIETIRKGGMEVGMVINPETRFEEVMLYLPHIDKITIMTVDPGFAGQAFIPDMLAKISQFKQFKSENDLNFAIEIDGSCNKKTFARLLQAGAEILVVGSSGLFNLNADLDISWDEMMTHIKMAQAALGQKNDFGR